MAISCPACGKTLADDPPDTCPRCSCDLVPLRQVLAAADQQVALAAAELRRGECSRALAYAHRAWSLRHTGNSARLAFLAAVGLRDTPSALAWFRRALEPCDQE